MEEFVAAGLHSTTHEKNTLRLELAFVTIPRCRIAFVLASLLRVSHVAYRTVTLSIRMGIYKLAGQGQDVSELRWG
jgi:hypothetical protein